MSYVTFDASSILAEYALQTPPTPRPAPALERRWLALIVFARHRLPPSIIGRLLNEADLHCNYARVIENTSLRLDEIDYEVVLCGLSPEQHQNVIRIITFDVTRHYVWSMEHVDFSGFAAMVDQVRRLMEPTHYSIPSGQPSFFYE